MATITAIESLPRASAIHQSGGGGGGGGTSPWETVTVAQLRAIRGGMFVTRGPVPYGPRPNQPDNIISINALANLQYDEPTAERAISDYRARGYTHGSIGPFVTTSYHGQDEALSLDWFRAHQDEVVARIEMLWRGGIIPIAFLSPDNWTLDEMRSGLEPIFRKDRWQKVLRMVVPKGYEPSIDTGNPEWCAWFDWAHGVFPHALYYLHMVSDFDAPGNNDDLTPSSPTYIGNEGCWRNLTPRMHGWLIQNGPFGVPPAQSPDFQNVCDQFRADVRASLRDRFVNNYAGWPSTSMWDDPRYSAVPRPFRGIDLVAGEYCAYMAWHHNFPEADCRAWGDGPLQNDADGSFDGCHAETVPAHDVADRTWVKPQAVATPLGKPWIIRHRRPVATPLGKPWIRPKRT